MMPQILDATAGNRTIWIVKDDPRVLFIDIEPDLEHKPDKLLDWSNTGFPDKSFHTIIFDPPHSFGREKNQGMYVTPSKAVYNEKWPQWRRPNALPRYYGLDKYATKAALMRFLNRSAVEFHRILQDDGILLLKWGENHSTIDAIIPLFDGFIEVMRTNRSSHGASSKGGIWVLLMKKQQVKI
jgi:hypothetical protein